MAEMSNMTIKIVGEFVKAMSLYTPDKIKECLEAQADGLKLTEAEQAKRDDAVKIIDGAQEKLKEIADREGILSKLKSDYILSVNAHEIKSGELLKQIAKANTRDEEQNQKQKDLDKKESDLKKLATDFEAKETKLASDYIALSKREAAINEEEEKYTQALQIVTKKK